MSSSIWWIRRDLRLNDNPALNASIAAGGQVIPLFIMDPDLWQGPWFSNRRSKFLADNLAQLDADLKSCGSRLIVRYGKPGQVLEEFVREHNVQSIFAEEDHTPYARRRDTRIAQALPATFVEGKSFDW